MPKLLELSIVLPVNNCGLFPLGLTGLILLQSKGLLRVFSSTRILQCSAFCMIQLTHPCMTPGKTIALTRWTFASKVMSLLFNMLSRCVITFFPELNVAIYVIQLWSLWTLVNFSLFYSQRAKWYAERPAQLLVSTKHSVSLFSPRRHLLAFLWVMGLTQFRTFLHSEWVENVTSYFSEYALLPEHLFHVYLNYFTYDQENKNKSQKKKPLEENMLVRTKRCTHHTHSPLIPHIFFSFFLRVYVHE